VRNRLAILGITAFIVWINRKSPLGFFEASEILACVLMLTLCIAPMVYWLKRGMTELPLFEIFCLLHFPLFGSSYLEARPMFMQYPLEVRLKCVAVVCVFLSVACAIYYGATRRTEEIREPSPFFNRWMPEFTQNGMFWMMLFAWWVFNVLFCTRVLTNSMTLVNPLRSVCLSAGIMAIFYFSLQSGRRRLAIIPELITGLVIATGIAANFAAGTLVYGIFVLIIALLAFAIGSRKVPIISAFIALAIINFLHLGKFEVRAKYWSPEDSTLSDSYFLNPLDVYSTWIDASWRRLAGELEEEEEATSIFKRASLLQVLALVLAETPDQRPYMLGETYAQIPTLFVPRYFNKDKPRGSLPTETLGIYYGIQTEESVKATSISFGPVAEAWANFGWPGVLVMGTIFGAFCASGTRISRDLAPNRVGFLLAVVMMGQVVDLENGFGTILVGTTQALAVGSLFLLFLSKPGGTQEPAIEGAVGEQLPGGRLQKIEG